MSVRAVRRSAFVTLSRLAELQGVDERTIRRWVRSGCPVARRGKAGHSAPLFDAIAVEAWTEANTSDEKNLIGSLIGKLDAKSTASARTLAELERDYLPAAEVATVWERKVRETAARCARIPTEVGACVLAASEKGVGSVECELEDGARALLIDLAGDSGDASAPSLRLAKVEASTTLRSARAQLATFETRVLAARDRIASGVSLSAVDVERNLATRVVAMRSAVLSWSHTLADRLHRAATTDGAVGVRIALEVAVARALAELDPEKYRKRSGAVKTPRSQK